MTQLNDTENFKVIIAEHDLTNENDCAYAVGVEEIIAHPAYNNTSFDGDFSILSKFWGTLPKKPVICLVWYFLYK